MTINLAAIEKRNEKLTADIADVADVLTMVLNSDPLNETTRGALVGSIGVLSGIVASDTAHEDIAALVAEVRRLEKAVSDISHLASGHHREQPSHVLLHCLTIDIPAICDAALTTTTSE